MTTVIDIQNAGIIRRDPANQKIVNRISTQTFQAGMFLTDWAAYIIADRLLNEKAYPLASVSFTANRKAFRLRPGDTFRFSWAKKLISEMICRVIRIEEETPASEIIKITAIEDSYCIGSFPNVAINTQKYGTSRISYITPLTNVVAMEAPYVLVEEAVKILSTMGREIGNEMGYELHMSIDGSSYNMIDDIGQYGAHGVLVSQYPPNGTNIYRIDDAVGFEVDFDSPETDYNLIESISRAQLLSGYNLCLLGSELICVQTITPDPVLENRYAFTGIYRGRYDTEPQVHAVDMDFWWLGSARFGLTNDDTILTGTMRYFKLNPYSDITTGNVSDASAQIVIVSGRVLKPYIPGSLTANGGGFFPQYQTGGDIVLDWHPRIRGEGAGIGDADSVVDAAPTWEGLFRVQVYVSDVKVREVTAIDDDTWTYTNAMIVTDNGSEPSEIEFRVSNYRTTGGVSYYSDPAIMTCYLR